MIINYYRFFRSLYFNTYRVNPVDTQNDSTYENPKERPKRNIRPDGRGRLLDIYV